MVLRDIKMTRIGRRLIEDFLLPALNDERYGDLLKWIDKDKCYFSIRWSHKNAAKWTLDDTAVFQDWDRLKGHYHPEIKGYYMQAKQRFRAALYKLSTVRKLACEDKHVKKYQLVLNPEKRHHDIMSRKGPIPRISPYLHIEDSQKSIPTSVICRNTSFIAKPEENSAEESSSSSSPSSPASSIKSESSEEKVGDIEVHKCLEEYQLAYKYQQMQSIGGYAMIIPGGKNLVDCSSSVLKESPHMNIVKPHVPTQPIPVYNKCSSRQVMENSQKRVESPHVLLVRTYNDSDTDVDTAHIKVEIKEELETNEHCNDSIESKYNCENSEVALNLSTKCDDIETLSR